MPHSSASFTVSLCVTIYNLLCVMIFIHELFETPFLLWDCDNIFCHTEYFEFKFELVPNSLCCVKRVIF